MHRRMTAWVGLAVVGALAIGGCAADAPSRDELVHALELTGIPLERAECAADAVLENLSDEQIEELMARGPAGAPRDDPDRTDDTSDEVRAAIAACQQVGTTTTTTTTAATNTPTTAAPTTSTGDGNVAPEGDGGNAPTTAGTAPSTSGTG